MRKRREVDNFFSHHELVCDKVSVAAMQHGKGSYEHRKSQLLEMITEEHAELLLDASFALAHIIAPFFRIPAIHYAETVDIDIERVREVFDSTNEAYAKYHSFKEASEHHHKISKAIQDDNRIFLYESYKRNMLHHIKRRQRNIKRIETILTGMAITSTTLSITSMLTEHAFHLAAASVITPVAAFTMAINEFAKGTRTAKAAWRAHKKTDPAYLWYCRFAKLQHVIELLTHADHQIEKYQKENNSESLNEWRKKKAKLHLDKQRLSFEVESLYQHIQKNSATPFKGKHFSVKQQESYRDAFRTYQYNYNKNGPTLSRITSKAIASSLIKKQYKKRKNLCNQSLSRYAGAIGLTLLAISAIPGVGQAVLITGIAITVAASIWKLYNVSQRWNSHRINDDEQRYIDKHTHFTMDDFKINKHYDCALKKFMNTGKISGVKTRELGIRQQMEYSEPSAFEKYKSLSISNQLNQIGYRYKQRIVLAYLQHKRSRTGDYTLEQFLSTLKEMSPKQSYELLRQAEKRHLQDWYLCSKQLPGDASDIEKQQFLQALSPKHRIHLLKATIKSDKRETKSKNSKTHKASKCSTMRPLFNAASGHSALTWH